MKQAIVLPRKYDNPHEKYPQHTGKPKLSWSQHTSWKDPQYQPQYIVQYFSGIKLPSGIWAEFGGETGSHIEYIGNKWVHDVSYKYLTAECIKFLETIEYPENCIYEDEVVVDMGDFVTQGYADRVEYITDSTVGIVDTKTGNIKTKAEYYGSEDYLQTVLYAHQKTQEGKEVVYNRVDLLGRKGNNMPGHPLRLSGEVKTIDTPYTPERAKKVLEDLRCSATEISECYKTYLRYFST